MTARTRRIGRQGRTDVLLAWTVDYKTGAILDLEPVILAQFEIDTNVYDTNW